MPLRTCCARSAFFSFLAGCGLPRGAGRARRSLLRGVLAAWMMAHSAAALGQGTSPPPVRHTAPGASPGRGVELRTAGIDLSYDVTEVRATAGEELTFRYINASETLQHNVVVVRGEEAVRPVGIAALQAHEHDYVPPDEMDRIVAFSDLAAPGDTVAFTFTVPPPGVYPYICTYSGHFTMMQGRLISTPAEQP